MRNLFLFSSLVIFGLVSCKKDGSMPVVIEDDIAVVSAAKHTVLIEPTVSVYCGACPLAHHQIESLESEFDNVTHMSHYLFGPLYHPYSKYLMDKIDKTVYTPLGHVDRRHEDGSVVYYPVNMFRGIYGQEIDESTGIGLAILRTQTTTEVEVTLQVTTESESLKAPMMVTVVLVEKEVTGVGNGYDQRNYGNDDPEHPYYQRGDWIEGFVHTQVIRDVWTAYEGDALDLTEGQATWTYSVNPTELDQDLSDYVIIAFVNRPGDEIQPILNAIQANLSEE